MQGNFAIACFIIFIAGIAVVEQSPILAVILVMVAVEVMNK